MTPNCLYGQSRVRSRSPTPIDAVRREPSQRVQSLWPFDRGSSTEVPRSDFSTTKAPAARFDRREVSSSEPYRRRDCYYQQLLQDSRD